ncbi:MAG TPA: hypothetical protein VHD83_19355 [Puia sp.]|nr:hypothetical protein [Puia sp.]
MKRTAILLLLLVCMKGSRAHVGSPDVAMEGVAGPYHLLVSIRPPDVIPGTARVTVYLQNGTNATITTQPVYYLSGRLGAPPAEVLQSVAGSPGAYTGIVWLMEHGSSSVLLHVKGGKGEGELVVPIVAISTAEKKLPAATGISLVILGSFLFILMVTLIGASVGEGITREGETLSHRRRRSRRMAFVLAALFTSLVVYGGNAWWSGWARKYRHFMFQPMHANFRIDHASGANALTMTIDTVNNQRRASLSYLVPDHGKIMHLFLMRLPGLDVFAHVHPDREDTAHFKVDLPPMPAGKYLAFADIVYSSGFTETIRDTLKIAADITSVVESHDADDAYAYALPNNLMDNPYRNDNNAIVCGKPGKGVRMKDGSEMVMEGGSQKSFESGMLYTLRFAVYDSSSRPVKLEPYMGMQGHAVIVKDDGSTYIHIHPVGTYSVAAQANLERRIGQPEKEYNYNDRVRFRDSVDQLIRTLKGMPAQERDSLLMRQMGMSPDAMGDMKMDNSVTFPYTFPQPGLYRIWVQVKRNGQVLTAAFDREVK